MGRIEVNTHPDVRKAGGYNEGGDGWHSQPNTILHELGHMVDYYMTHLFPKTGKEQIGDRFDKLNEAQVKKILSEYGATQAVEFRAELISGILAGKAYPKEFLTAAYLDKYLSDERGKAIFEMGSGEVPNTTMLEKQFGSMMQALFHEEGASLRIEILGDADVEKFIDTHAQVLDNAFVNTEMSDTMRARLQESDWMFSGMKTFHELNEAFPSLIREDGSRKPFKEFLKDVQTVDKTYNGRYLKAEYNFANASADMAARWERFEDSDRYLLQYRTQNDGAVRPEHAALHGVTLPASDSFWDTYFPPNGWNCRCTVVQVLRDKYPETDHNEAMRLGREAMTKDTKGMFSFNPGKEGRVFPAHNPYTISRCATCDKAKINLATRGGANNNELCNACQYYIKCMKDEGYFYDSEVGKRLKISYHADVDELEENISAARDLLRSIPDATMEIRPHSNVINVKNPEYLINGIIADRKGIEGYNGITSGFVKAIRQGCHSVYIDLDEHLSEKPLDIPALTSKLYGRHDDFQNGTMDSCFIRYRGDVVVVPKTTFSGDKEVTKKAISEILKKIKG